VLVFVYLALHRDRKVGREELIEAVWPEQTRPRAADSALSSLLSKLRQVLGPDALPGRGEARLVLPGEAWIDLEAAAAALHRAQSAVALEDWTAAWAPARISALECAAEVGLGLGGPELAATERSGRRLIELEPYRESGYRFLMEALERRDNVAEALRVYERLRVTLREELGVPPGVGAQALHKRLLDRGSARS